MMKISPALAAIIDYTDQVESALNPTRVMAKNNSCRVYLYERNDYYCAVAYRGRSKKAVFRYRYPTELDRANAVSKWFSSQLETQERCKPKARTLEIGDVVKASWGYDQTNIDYYKVIGLVGKTMVRLIEIGQDRNQTESMAGDCVPNVNQEIGESFKRKVNGDSVRIDSVRYARKIEYKEVAGTRVYSASHYTQYH